MMTKVMPSISTHKFKECIELILPAAMMLHVHLVLSMKDTRTKEGANTKAIK
jgi:hypothetical protein